MTMHNQSTVTAPPGFDGQRLRSLRQERGFSADKLASQSELCARQIWRMEAGHRPNVRALTLARIAQALETSIDYLMGLTDDPGPYGRVEPDEPRLAEG